MQPTPSASYSLTLRVRLSSRAGSLGELTIAIGRAGGDIGAIDIVTVGNNYIIRDITVSSVSSTHGEQIVEVVKDIDGVELLLEPSGHPAVGPFKSALVEDGIPATSFAVDDVDAEHERLSALGVTFTQPPTQMGPVTTAVFDDTCGNLIQIAAMATG